MDAANPALPFPPPPPEFDDFVEGENRQALAAVRTLSAQWESAESAQRGEGGGVTNTQQDALPVQAIYVWGGSGCGKTHLLRVAAHSARQYRQTAFYVSAHDSLPQPQPSLLAVDNIERLSSANRLLLFDWQNKIAPAAAYRILAAGNAPPNELPLGTEIAARLTAGLVFRLRELSETEKREALARYAHRRGFDLPVGVVHLLLTRLPRDMSSLVAALADLDRFLLAQHKSLTLPLAHAWLQQKTPSLLDNNRDSRIAPHMSAAPYSGDTLTHQRTKLH